MFKSMQEPQTLLFTQQLVKGDKQSQRNIESKPLNYKFGVHLLSKKWKII